jgi:hypothetical protein
MQFWQLVIVRVHVFSLLYLMQVQGMKLRALIAILCAWELDGLFCLKHQKCWTWA